MFISKLMIIKSRALHLTFTSGIYAMVLFTILNLNVTNVSQIQRNCESNVVPQKAVGEANTSSKEYLPPSSNVFAMYMSKEVPQGRLLLPKRMNFRKSSKRQLTLPPSFFGKLYCKFFLKFMTEVSSIMAKICNINFWIENDPPPLELFRKFIHFGRERRP